MTLPIQANYDTIPSNKEKLKKLFALKDAKDRQKEFFERTRIYRAGVKEILQEQKEALKNAGLISEVNAPKSLSPDDYDNLPVS